jgi:hypothetical protein
VQAVGDGCDDNFGGRDPLGKRDEGWKRQRDARSMRPQQIFMVKKLSLTVARMGAKRRPVEKVRRVLRNVARNQEPRNRSTQKQQPPQIGGTMLPSDCLDGRH